MPNPANASFLQLGKLESKIMKIVWARGRMSVREVADLLDPPLAYTTVMTTLVRLFNKGFLDRCESDRTSLASHRAFEYWAPMTQQEWQAERAKRMIDAVLQNADPSRELLLSALIDSIGQHDPTLLDELELKISQTRDARNNPQDH